MKNAAQNSVLRMMSITGLNQKLTMITRSVGEKSNAFLEAIRA